jgi:transposase
MAGRPTKYSPEVEKKICDALRAGNTRKASCGYAGIGETTLATWLADPDFGDFGEAVKKAESDAEVRNVAIIQKASDKSWTAAAWWLERRRKDDWAVKQEMKHEGEVTVKVVYEAKSDTPLDTDTPSGPDPGSF